MKTITHVLCAILVCVLPSCNEQEKATAQVMRNKTIDALVEHVGKADVALELYKRELRQRKENWIRLKQLSITYERRAREAAEAAQTYRAEGKDKLAVMKEQESQKFASRVEMFKSREAKVEESFRTFQVNLEEKRVALQILKDEVASLKAMGSLSDDLVTDESAERLAQAQELEESIKQDIDRAQAAIDVNLSTF